MVVIALFLGQRQCHITVAAYASVAPPAAHQDSAHDFGIPDVVPRLINAVSTVLEDLATHALTDASEHLLMR